jgi:methionyl-tRNA formyltransferase
MAERSLTGIKEKYNKKIVVVGCLMVGWELINALLEQGLSVDHIVTITPEKAAKAKVAGYADFGDLGKKYNIPVYYAEKYSLNGEADIRFFNAHQFDLLLQGGWQRLFPEHLLDTLSIGALGIHGSSEFLPKGRGRSPLNWSLIENKKRFIIHLFIIKPGVDDGDVFDYEMFDINEHDDIRSLYLKNYIVTKNMLLRNMENLLAGSIKVYPQSGEPTYYPARKPEDGLIDWAKTVTDVYNHIRALTHPYPGAFTYLNNEKRFIWKAVPFDTRIAYYGKQEGEVVEIFREGDFIVNCNSGLLRVIESDAKPSVGDVFKNS